MRRLPLFCSIFCLLITARICTGQSIDPEALQWLSANVQTNLGHLLDPPDGCNPISRDITNGALAALLLADGEPWGNGTSLTPESPACVTAISLLHEFGAAYDMSFGGQAIPMIYANYLACFNASELAWFQGAINASLPQTSTAATTSDVSYNNMHIMAMVEAVLFGELARPFAGERAEEAARVGYSMLEEWMHYAQQAVSFGAFRIYCTFPCSSFCFRVLSPHSPIAFHGDNDDDDDDDDDDDEQNKQGIHEFNSPTYTYVQLTSLYTGYIHTTNVTAKRSFEYAIDAIWATTAANSFRGGRRRGGGVYALSGPHSRDYDTLLGHGMLLIEMYLMALPGAEPLACEYRDPHCEGAPESCLTAEGGNGEPMTVTALSLYNALHPNGCM
jgi:hypothetical protein